MLIHELTADTCLDVLNRNHLGRLACAWFNQPYVVPIFFSCDAGRRCLYAFSHAGQKIEWMRRNPRVCVEVEEIDDRNHWTTVLVFGRYEEIDRNAEHAAARARAAQLFQQRQEWWLPGAARTPEHEPHEMVVYRIEIDRLTGRQAKRDPG